MALGCLGVAPLAALASESDWLAEDGEGEVALAAECEGEGDLAGAAEEAPPEAVSLEVASPEAPAPSEELAAAEQSSDPAQPLAQDATDDAPVTEDAAPQPTTFTYKHDPRNNPKAMADIIVNPYAIYGFAPSPEGSLASFASADWTDPEIVAQGRKDRIDYHMSVMELYTMIVDMGSAGASDEEIARAVSTRRNEIRLESYANNPEGLARVKERNLEIYGNELGGTPEYFYELYGSWQTVIWKSVSINPGMDACLGLYDDYYYLYVAAGYVPADEQTPDDSEQSSDSSGDPAPSVVPVPAENASEGQASGNGGQTQVAREGNVSKARVVASAKPASLPATGDMPLERSAAALAGASVLLLCAGIHLRRDQREAA